MFNESFIAVNICKSQTMRIVTSSLWEKLMQYSFLDISLFHTLSSLAWPQELLRGQSGCWLSNNDIWFLLGRFSETGYAAVSFIQKETPFL